jgi:hypothetical protein
VCLLTLAHIGPWKGRQAVEYTGMLSSNGSIEIRKMPNNSLPAPIVSHLFGVVS